MLNDPIADFLTRIRNATMSFRRHVEIPGSKIKKRLADIFKEEGFIEDVKWTDDGKQGIIHITLKYDDNGYSVIEGIHRESRPGLRAYCGHDEIPRVRSGLGIVILNTSKGVLTGKQAREEKVGGEVVCSLW